MIDYKQLQALAAILEESSFDKAANRLHISQSAVSQRLRQLEEQIGQPLVIRSNPVQATAAGQHLLKHYRQVALLQTELQQELSQQMGAGFTPVSIGINADSLGTWFLEAVQPLVEQENLLLDLKVEDQDQTHHLLKSGQVIGCISSNPDPMQGCNCLPLGVMPYRCLASPAYLARYFPNGVSSEAFRAAPVAEYSNKDELQNRYLATYFQLGPNDYPRHRIPATESFLQMIVLGMACGMVPDQQSHPFLESGAVVDMSPGQYLAIPLYWHVWNLKSNLYRKLTHHLSRAAEQQLDPFTLHQHLL